MAKNPTTAGKAAAAASNGKTPPFAGAEFFTPPAEAGEGNGPTEDDDDPDQFGQVIELFNGFVEMAAEYLPKMSAVVIETVQEYAVYDTAVKLYSALIAREGRAVMHQDETFDYCLRHATGIARYALPSIFPVEVATDETAETDGDDKSDRSLDD